MALLKDSMVIELLINGIPFDSGSKEIDPNNPYTLTPLAGGIKVQWSPSDVDILSGTSWHTTSRATIRQNVLSNNVEGTNGLRCAVIDDIHVSEYLGIQKYTPPSSYPNNIYQPNIGACSCCQTPRSKATSGTWILSRYNTSLGEIGILMFGSSNSSVTITVDTPVIEHLKTVITDTGAISTRTTNTTPTVSLLAGNCGAVVNYIDGTQSPAMEFPLCPTVTIQECFDCPEAIGILNQILGLL
jgi:hypothetical protein